MLYSGCGQSEYHSANSVVHDQFRNSRKWSNGVPAEVVGSLDTVQRQNIRILPVNSNHFSFNILLRLIYAPHSSPHIPDSKIKFTLEARTLSQNYNEEIPKLKWRYNPRDRELKFCNKDLTHSKNFVVQLKCL